ncbi:MAG: hypothetical protein SF069_01160 [Phycisphaerae bacterium]|nr:hypothetical protein [Phycisphaerae bacterium]
MSKLYHMLATVAIAQLLALGGVLGYLGATGGLSAGSIEQIVRILRGEEFVSASAASQPTSSQAASQASSQPVMAAAVDDNEVTTAAERVAARARESRLSGLRVQRALQELAAREELLRHAQQSLIEDQEAFEAERTRWNDQRSKLAQQAQDEGFKSELRSVTDMSPQLAKEHLMRTWKKSEVDAVRLLNALPPTKKKKILEQFKGQEEFDLMHRMLEQVRLQEPEARAAKAGMPAAEKKP